MVFCLVTPAFGGISEGSLQDLVDQLRGTPCPAALGDSTLVLNGDLLTIARQREFKTHYPQVQFVPGLAGGGVEVNLAGLSSDDATLLVVDLLFLKTNPNVPLENLVARLDNYKPNNDSQKELLYWARRLINYTGGRASGLFVSGPAGVGKTHITVAVAKESLKTGQRVAFFHPEQRFLRIAAEDAIKSGVGVFVFDDVNNGYTEIGRTLASVVLHVHSNGGRVFVTTNSTLEKLLEAAVGLPGSADRVRFDDRTKNIFKQLIVTGDSQRSAAAWYED